MMKRVFQSYSSDTKNILKISVSRNKGSMFLIFLLFDLF